MKLTVAPKVSKKLPLGTIAGVVYGKKISGAYSIQFDKNEFIRLYRQCGSSTPFDLVGGDINQMVLVQDFQKTNVSNMVYHVDFLAIDKDQKVQTHVPLKFTGESLVEKNGTGRIQYLRDNIVVEALPGDLPHDITLDISSIETLNDSLFIKDLVVSDKVIIKEEMDMPIVVAVAISEEKEETVATEETATTDKPTTEEPTKSK